MKIMTIVGARPQFIKAALVSREISRDRNIREILVHTGQHYDFNMSGTFFKELGLRPAMYNLGIGSLSASKQISAIINGLAKLYSKENPDLVMVYGDTNSTLAGALSAASARIPIAHVESGLRSYDLNMPEEVNRVLTDRISTLLFCPTAQSVKNLFIENIRNGVYRVGDIMYELALASEKAAQKKSQIVESLSLVPGSYLLLTVHRQSNTDIKSHLESIINAVNLIDKKVVFSVHPRTRKMIKKFGLLSKVLKNRNLLMINPVGYLDMVNLEVNAEKILTDSGGVQKEAYFFKVPCITLREQTEWVETLNGGWNKLVGTDPAKIVSAAQEKKKPGSWRNYYGNGDTSTRIVNILKKMRLN